MLCGAITSQGERCMECEIVSHRAERKRKEEIYQRTKAQVREQIMKAAEEDEKEVFYGDSRGRTIAEVGIFSPLWDKMINGAKRFFDPNYGKA